MNKKNDDDDVGDECLFLPKNTKENEFRLENEMKFTLRWAQSKKKNKK